MIFSYAAFSSNCFGWVVCVCVLYYFFGADSILDGIA